ncbi:MAG: DnaJ domain-containing protein [Anaerolineae bacterium]|nr:DnaJ domain-containing protein [Anaerolineae bacterium]
MADIQAQIARLQAEIDNQESELADLETEVLDLEREMGDFIKRYNQLVQPIEEKLDLVRGMIADLEREHAPPPPQLGSRPITPPLEKTWTPPPDYVSVEEQYRRMWEVPKQQRQSGQEPVNAPSMRKSTVKPDNPEQAIKKLYRQLARRYHPDLTTDPAERARRNRLMAEINDAYSRRDMAALQALAAQPENARIEQPLAALQLVQLQQIRNQLEDRIYALRKRRNELLHGDLMRLKIQASLEARKGRDLLRRMAADMEKEYTACLDRLDQLRNV